MSDVQEEKITRNLIALRKSTETDQILELLQQFENSYTLSTRTIRILRSYRNHADPDVRVTADSILFSQANEEVNHIKVVKKPEVLTRNQIIKRNLLFGLVGFLSVYFLTGFLILAISTFAGVFFQGYFFNNRSNKALYQDF